MRPREPHPFCIFDLLDLVESAMGPRSLPGSSGRHGWTNDDLAARLGLSAAALKKFRLVEPMLTARQADRLAVAAGYHPAEVWPHWWEEAA